MARSPALRRRAIARVWQPFTQMQDWETEEFPVVVSARGTTLTDADGRRYIDGNASLWCNVHGHRHPAIAGALKRQLGRAAHTTLLGLCHPGAIELAERLVEIAPPGLNHVFFSDSGSEALEVALKMAFQHWRQRGEERDTFVTFGGAYHGDTLGAVSAGAISLFHGLFRPLLFPTVQVPCPYSPRDPGGAARRSLASLEKALRTRRGRVAAVVIEPVVQGAAGILPQPPGFVAAVRELCNGAGTLLIADEVAVGFGRTGRMFACEHDGVAPDLLALGKGITSGYLPLSATLATDRIYEAFLAPWHRMRQFFHGHTFAGNPLACAAALASLDVFRRERTLDRLPAKIARFEDRLARFRGRPHVADVRSRGLMGAVEVEARPGRPFPAARRMGHRIILECRRRGVVLRPLGDAVVLMPALSMDLRTMDRMFDVLEESLPAAVRS
ncbi:MAG: adenosylmethionine--8-amino-7-oxononanoate transaminase [Planctomycetia bacterium]|nr:adenosylmethionine--8-amino-7-oxononanoate transaminase [Planctomycetia bacterium]